MSQLLIIHPSLDTDSAKIEWWGKSIELNTIFIPH
ncbi:hypothetical protein HMPREF9706_01232 [Facklamia hominis CCUG 36813]|uniref:Uncharacterized protein n=1 Tax=Facklamia hominis CCUG 36813 TaxID=883111 RepID=K1LSE9_9LACT|nr:hypothetical protein HMPREF9706_01232 [Facklamia hominis CCUG 36813]